MLLPAMWPAAAPADPVAGTWEGTSLCQVKPSACHDEHVIYRTTLIGPGRYKIDAYKVVSGKELFMGAIDVQLDPARAQLDGPVMSGGQARGRLHLALKGTHLSGTMTLADGTLYRLIEADKH